MHYYLAKAGFPITPTEDDFVPEYRSTYSQRKACVYDLNIKSYVMFKSRMNLHNMCSIT